VVKNNKELKSFCVRLPHDTWLFLKHTSAEQGVSMADIIVRCVDKYRKKLQTKVDNE